MNIVTILGSWAIDAVHCLKRLVASALLFFIALLRCPSSLPDLHVMPRVSVSIFVLSVFIILEVSACFAICLIDPISSLCKCVGPCQCSLWFPLRFHFDLPSPWWLYAAICPAPMLSPQSSMPMPVFQVGGYPEWRLMEDVELVRRLKQATGAKWSIIYDQNHFRLSCIDSATCKGQQRPYTSGVHHIQELTQEYSFKSCVTWTLKGCCSVRRFTGLQLGARFSGATHLCKIDCCCTWGGPNAHRHQADGGIT